MLLSLVYGVGLRSAEIANVRAQLEPLHARPWTAIDLAAFADGLRHARSGRAAWPYRRHRPEEIIHIAENLLLLQRPDGGWPKNVDWLRVLGDDDRAILPWGLVPVHPGNRNARRWARSTIDNHNVHPQIRYLAEVHRQTELDVLRDASLRGIDYLLRQQRPSGGWSGADLDAVTFNDDVTQGVLAFFREVLSDRTLYGFVDRERTSHLERAYASGIAYILRCQIEVRGRSTGWAQQHAHEDCRPLGGRRHEPAAIASRETVSVVRLLMGIDRPGADVVQAIRSAARWLDETKLTGIRVVSVPTAPIESRYRTIRADRVVIEDPDAEPIWARFYDLRTGRPVFATSQGAEVDALEKVDRTSRSNYAWYDDEATDLLRIEYPAWERRRAPVPDGRGPRGTR